MVYRYQGIPKFYYLRITEDGKEVHRPFVPKQHDGDETPQGFYKIGVYNRDREHPIEYVIIQSDDPDVMPTPPGSRWELDEVNTNKKNGHYVFERRLSYEESFTSFEKFRFDEQWPARKKERVTREVKGDRKPDFGKGK
jgi:hypothetical protein